MVKTYQKAAALLLALALIFALPVPASAAETTEARVPVTLTVVNTVSPISCTGLCKSARKWRRRRMIIEILSLAAALEWIAMGVLVFFKLRSQKRRLEEAIKELENAIR